MRSADELFDLWCSSVGGNATFLLNVPPNAAGLVATPDEEALRALGDRIRRHEAARVPAAVSASSGTVPPGFAAAPAAAAPAAAPAAAGSSAPWAPDADDHTPWLELRFDHPETIVAIELREDIAQGQRLEHVRIRALGDDADGDDGDGAHESAAAGPEATGAVLAETHSVGHRRIVRLDPTTVGGLRIELPGSRALPQLLDAGAIRA